MVAIYKFIQNNKNTIFYIISGFVVVYAIYTGVQQNIGNRLAYEQGICIKAHVESDLYTGNIYSTKVTYVYKGVLYKGIVTSKERLVSDSMDIKILQANPSFLSRCN